MSEEITAAPSHPSGIAPARTHPAVVAAMVFAWLLLAAGAIIVVAHFLGWLPKGTPGLPPLVANEAKPAPAAHTQSGVVLLPGETLVEAPEANPAPSPAAAPPVKPAPAKPTYAKPAPKPAPAPRTAQAAPRPPQSRAPASTAQPAPQYSRAEIRGRSEPSVCLNCATITSIQPRGDAWEVAVRFDDGSREVIRYYDPPPLRIGDAVHLEDGRLIRD